MTKALIRNLADLRARCVRVPATGCWIWAGPVTEQVRIWAVDHARGLKRSMGGGMAAWSIAHGRMPPAGSIIYRTCCNRLCLNWAHLALAQNRSTVNQHYALHVGPTAAKSMAARRNAAAGRAARGIVDTPAETVRAIRAAPAGVTNAALAREFCLGAVSVGKIRRGLSRAGVSQP